jgi:hypothetical protein
LLLGFGAALRRSELVGLDVEDLEPAPADVLLHLRRSKTGAVPKSLHPEVCPGGALERWLQAARIASAGGRGDQARPERVPAEPLRLYPKRVDVALHDERHRLRP